LRIIAFDQDLQKYLDEAPDGVIYFNMGSNLRSASIPESKRNSFLGAFPELSRVCYESGRVKLREGECCYTVETVGISCIREGAYWRQRLRSSLASFQRPLPFGRLLPTFQVNHLPAYDRYVAREMDSDIHSRAEIKCMLNLLVQLIL